MPNARVRKYDKSLESTHIDEPCPKCGATTRRVGIVMDPTATSLPMVSLCAVCKHNFGGIDG